MVGVKRAEIKDGVRMVVLCKDASGKMGLRVRHVSKVCVRHVSKCLGDTSARCVCDTSANYVGNTSARCVGATRMACFGLFIAFKSMY